MTEEIINTAELTQLLHDYKKLINSSLLDETVSPEHTLVFVTPADVDTMIQYIYYLMALIEQLNNDPNAKVPVRQQLLILKEVVLLLNKVRKLYEERDEPYIPRSIRTNSKRYNKKRYCKKLSEQLQE